MVPEYNNESTGTNLKCQKSKTEAHKLICSFRKGEYIAILSLTRQ